MDSIEQILLKTIQGDIPLEDLSLYGIKYQYDGQHCELVVPDSIFIQPTFEQVLMGLYHYECEQELLQQWAGFVLVNTNIINLTLLDHHPLGKTLLSALRDGYFYGEFSSDIWAELESLYLYDLT